MTAIRQKKGRLRLDPDAYRQLCWRVLERDAWKCQSCGARQHLQVHHIEFRSHFGSDSEENLLTLCAQCHGVVHAECGQKCQSEERY